MKGRGNARGRAALSRTDPSNRERAVARPGLGFGVDRPRSMRSRLRDILTDDRPGRRSRTACAFVAIAALALLPTWTSGPPTPSADATADGPGEAEPSTRVEGVASRGVVRFGEGAELPVLEPDGWFVAFFDPASGPVRRLVMWRDGQDAATVDRWLRRVTERARAWSLPHPRTSVAPVR